MNITNNTIIKIGAFALAIVAAYAVIGAFFAHAEAAPTVNASIRNASEAAITSAHVGASVHSIAQVASSTSSSAPQGNVDFNVYGNTSCTGSATTESNVALVNGFATSSATTVPAGGLSYKVHYHGDANNIAADSACMPLTATSNSAALTLGLSAATINAGQSVNASSTLGDVTSNATGTVSYTVYSNASCSTPYGGAGNVTVNNGSVPNSPPFQFNTAGTYYWQAVYSGDMNNNAATSSCANGALTVQAVSKNSPTISTTLSTSSIQIGTSVRDSASISGATSNASGTVTYKVFTNSACTNLFASAGSKSVTNASVADSDSVLFNSAGTYYWQAVYSGDSRNNAVTSSCTAETLTVADHGSSTTPIPTGNGTLSGQVFDDANDNGVLDAGETGLSGFQIHLYQGTNFNGFEYDPVYKTAITDANGNYSFTGLLDGIYSVEQVLKKGWKQTTDDYTSVTVSGGNGQSGLNFGDIAGPKSKERGHGTEKDNHGRHIDRDNGDNQDNDDNDDNDDADENDDHVWQWSTTTATATQNLIFNIHINHGEGLHLGWFIGKGNHDEDKRDD